MSRSNLQNAVISQIQIPSLTTLSFSFLHFPPLIPPDWLFLDFLSRIYFKAEVEKKKSVSEYYLLSRADHFKQHIAEV